MTASAMVTTPERMKLLHASTREDWRAWLEEHYEADKEIWLVYYKKHTGKPRIAYNDAVEEALCFGWIDSTARRLDEDRFAQRFSPRRPGSPYSQPNKERLRALAEQGRLLPEILESVRPILAEDDQSETPADILEAIRASPQAWAHFQQFSPPYVRIRIAFIEAARKRPAEFEKRLRHFVSMTERGRRFGFGGIEKYY